MSSMKRSSRGTWEGIHWEGVKGSSNTNGCISQTIPTAITNSLKSQWLNTITVHLLHRSQFNDLMKFRGSKGWGEGRGLTLLHILIQGLHFFTFLLWCQDHSSIIQQEDEERWIVGNLWDIVEVTPRKGIYCFCAYSIGQTSVVWLHPAAENAGKKYFVVDQLDKKTDLGSTWKCFCHSLPFWSSHIYFNLSS